MQDLKPDNTVAQQTAELMEEHARINERYSPDDGVSWFGTRRQLVTKYYAESLPSICWQEVSEKIRTQRVIVCAALRYPDLDLVIPGARHYSPDIGRLLDRLEKFGVMTKKKQQVVGDNQGFIDNFGNYWTREEALIIAKAASQVNPDKCGRENELYSEDLY